MAHITRWPLWRHLRAEPTQHLLHYKHGKAVRSGRGLAFWILPLTSSVAEVPCDDRDLPFLFHARTRDFQDVTTQGIITYRVVDPEALASRVDFSIDLRSGAYRETPLEQLGQMLVQLAQQSAIAYVAETDVRTVLAEGVRVLRDRVSDGLHQHEAFQAMGLEIVSVRVSDVSPTAELEKALQTPTREAIQQESDEATFQRRALAVEKERAIAENELQNRIELARREQMLITEEGANDRKRAEELAQALGIEAAAEAERTGLESNASAESIRVVEEAKNAAERARMDIYRDLPPRVTAGLAVREFATKLSNIERIHIAPETLAPTLRELVEAGARYLDGRALGTGEEEA